MYNYDKMTVKGGVLYLKIKAKLIPAIIAVFSLFSCTVAPADPSRDLISGMEKRYEDKFTITENAGGGTGLSEHLAVYVSSEKFPDARIYAVHGNFDGKTEDRDNYMAYYLKKDAEDYLHGLAEAVYGECRLVCRPDEKTVLPADITIGSSAADMLRSTKVYCSVYLPPEQDISDKEQKLDRLFDSLKANSIRCYLYVAYLSDKDKYSSISDEITMDREFVKTDVRLGMDDSFNITEKQWG